jgi:hypothetical protein
MEPTLLRQQQQNRCWRVTSSALPIAVFTATELRKGIRIDAAHIVKESSKEVAACSPGWITSGTHPQRGLPLTRSTQIRVVKSLVRQPKGGRRCYSVVTKDEFAVAFREQLQTGKSETPFR